MLNALRYGAWIRTKTPPFRAVKWVPDEHPDGRATLRGRRWQEILRVGQAARGAEPERFFAEDVTTAGPMEYLEYPPAKDEPICGYWMAYEGEAESGALVLFHADRYCPRPTKPGTLCPRHEAEFASMDQGEDHRT